MSVCFILKETGKATLDEMIHNTEEVNIRARKVTANKCRR